MKKQRFAIQTRQLICPQCRQYIGRQETRRVRIGKGYQVKGVPGFDYGELCKDCAEKQELAKEKSPAGGWPAGHTGPRPLKTTEHCNMTAPSSTFFVRPT